MFRYFSEFMAELTVLFILPTPSYFNFKWGVWYSATSAYFIDEQKVQDNFQDKTNFRCNCVKVNTTQ